MSKERFIRLHLPVKRNEVWQALAAAHLWWLFGQFTVHGQPLESGGASRTVSYCKTRNFHVPFILQILQHQIPKNNGP